MTRPTLGAMPGTSLPRSWYTDEEVLSRELATAFRHAWQYVGHTSDLPRRGSSFPAAIGSVPLAITRDRADRLRALVAVCRHRGAVIRQPAGPATSLRCAYHGWVYGLDGALRSAPRSAVEPPLDEGARALPEVPVARVGPLVFACADPGAPPPAEALGALADRLAEMGVDVDALRFHSRARTRLAANWKIVAEDFLDCSPGFRCHLLHPATVIEAPAGPPNLSIGALLPAGTAATERVIDRFFAPGAGTTQIAALLATDARRAEDTRERVESVQLGVSAVPDPGPPLMAERPIGEFRRWLAAQIEEA